MGERNLYGLDWILFVIQIYREPSPKLVDAKLLNLVLKNVSEGVLRKVFFKFCRKALVTKLMAYRVLF